MKKVYIVRLNDAERETCLAVVKKLKGSSAKVRRANILLKADADGPNWKDQQIVDAFFCTRQCVENLRKRLVTECVKRRRFGTIEELREEVMAWAASRNTKQKGVDWQFTTDDARVKLESLYPKFLY